MIKFQFFLILCSFSICNSFAQLEVNDTLLMAYSNETFWSSSSELEKDIYADFGKYGSTNVADNDPTTCWAEGAESDGSNEYIWLTIPYETKTLRIRNGYQKTENIYWANNRPRNIELQLFACYDPEGYVTESHNGFFISEKLLNIQAALEDKLGYQDLNINFNWGEIEESLSHNRTFVKDLFILKIKIVDVYKGNKWNDACISDIYILPNPYYELTEDEHGLLKVSLNEIDTLLYNSEYIYQVMEISPNSEWIIFTLMPSEIEFSRAETIYKLFSAKREKFVEVKELTSMYGFIKESSDYYLEGLNKELNDTIIIIK